MVGEKLSMMQRLDWIESEIKKIESSKRGSKICFNQLGLLRQESVDIKRNIRRENLILLLLKLAAIDSKIWRLIEFSKIKPLSQYQIDEQLFDNFF